jgi:integrase
MGYQRTHHEERLQKLENQEYVSSENFDAFEEFVKCCQADDAVSNRRIYDYVTKFKALFKKFVDVPLKEADKKDIRDVVGSIQGSDEYSEWSKKDFKTSLRKFYYTIYSDELDRPRRVKKILKSGLLAHSGTPENEVEKVPLTPEEVVAVKDSANNVRDKFLVFFLFETGARIGEVLGLPQDGVSPLKIGDLNIKSQFVEVTIPTIKNDKGKRNLVLTKSVGLLQRWLENHPCGEDKQAPLFVNLNKGRGSPMSRKNVGKILRRASNEAGIDKTVTPHIFRYTSATYYATEKDWSTTKLMQWFGWKQPNMVDRYCKRDEERLKRHKLENAGIEVDGSGSEILDEQICGSCGHTNSPTRKYCGGCRLALSKDVAQEQQSVEDATNKVVEARINGELSEEDIRRRKQDILSEMEGLKQEMEGLSEV